MKKIHLSSLVCIALLSVAPLRAQMPNVPAPILSAKTIFLGNAGTNTDGDSERAFVGFYQQLTTWNRYQVVTDPAKADLVAEISVNSFVGSTSKGESHKAYYIHLTVRDEKTQTLLWSFSETAKGSSSRKKSISNFDDALASLGTDFKSIASSTLPPMQ